jgi:hypothetical protein
MTTDREVTRIVRSWLGDEEYESADRVLDFVFDRLDTTPQRRSWWPAWRIPNVSNAMRVALVAIAVAAVLVGGAFALNSLPTTPAATPSPAPTPSPTAVPTRGTAALDPGSYTTQRFEPTITYTVPDGWKVTTDAVRRFRMEPVTGGAQLDVCRGQIQAVDNYNVPVPGIGTTVDELIDYVSERAALTVEEGPTAIEIDGLTGYWMQIKNESSPEEVVLGPDCGFNVYGDPASEGATVRFALLDVGDGTIILPHIFTFPGSEIFNEQASEIVTSMKFDLP